MVRKTNRKVKKAKAPRGLLLQKVRNYFFTGLVIAAPIGITIYLTWSFISYVDARVKPLIPQAYNPETYLPISVPGLGLIFSFVFLTGLGWVTAKTFGRSIVGWGERLVARMPVVRWVYNSLKQIVETIMAQRESTFQKVGLIQYPRPGLWAVVFITSDTEGEIAERMGRAMVNVFLPTTPNPTSGYLLFVPREDVIILDMSVEQAAKVVISGGLVNPPPLNGGPAKAAPSKPTPQIVQAAQKSGPDAPPETPQRKQG